MTITNNLMGVQLTLGQSHVVASALQKMLDYTEAYDEFWAWAKTGVAKLDSIEWNEMREYRDTKAEKAKRIADGLILALQITKTYDDYGLSEFDADTISHIINVMQSHAQMLEHHDYEHIMQAVTEFMAQV